MAYVWNQVSRFAVPMFILLSGLSLTLGDKGNEGKLDFFKKRYSKILLPYVIWSVIYFVYANRYQLFTADPVFILVQLGKQMIKGTAYVHLYYLVITFQLYFFYPFLKKLFQINKMMALMGSFILTFGFHLVIYLHANQVFILPSIRVPYVVLFPVWVFYFVLGMFAATKFDKFHLVINRLALPPIFVLWIITIVVLILDSKWTQTFTSSSKPTTLLYTLVSAFFLYKVALIIGGWKGRVSQALGWFSRHTFLIYLIHPLIISQILFHFPWIRKGDLGMVMVFILTVACSCILTNFGSRFKMTYLFGGVYTRPRFRREESREEEVTSNSCKKSER